MANIELLHCDCMEYMATLKDNEFDLAIVDPPYGIGFDGEKETMVKNKSKKWNNTRGVGYIKKDWDKEKPNKEYFKELFRVSKNQIIWGGNYFELPISGGWVVWDKKRPADFSLSQGELAWVRNSGRVAIFRYLYNGFQKEIQEQRFHPTQKPVKLYKWLLQNYAKQGDKILDTHGGSRSLAIACHEMGFDHVSCEIDLDYHNDSVKRFKEQTMQLDIFK